ncbi:uncharacterized protein LOC117579747 [Drosophila guanche]|uniref:Chitin-binding type-2 domain-containing protein n=1 Tax=Drosophila guanche TaxID=7266 RepID=A0A3B0J627_DROGU|nr:uncharacterized protein LOC117579747 [Drosophila guanche]SPP77357.1 Hypothetical predicted protein [Drosophila guanche]
MLRLLILLAIAVLGCQAECNVCSSAANVACVSATEYQICSEAHVPLGAVTSCPTNYFCSANGTFCSPNEAYGACVSCNKCSADKSFACISASQFALCLGQDTPSTSIVGNCGTSLVCNVENPEICGSSSAYPASCGTNSSGGGGSSTSITDPTLYCRSLQQPGRFPYGSDATTTCRQYVSCYTFKGIWYGAIYTCAGSTYFDSTTRLCTTQTQARCAFGVTSLTLNGRLLP